MDPIDETDEEYVDEERKGQTCCKNIRRFEFSDPRAFTASLTFSTMIFAAGFSYITGVMRTLEKRFGLTSTEVNTLMSVMDFISSALLLFVGYAGCKCHKPRLLAILLFFMVVAQLVFFGGPYFYFSTGDILNVNATADQENTTQPLCILSNENQTSTASPHVKCLGNEGNSADGSRVFPLFVVGALLIGVAGTGPVPLGLSYIDENVPKDRSAAHMGFATAAWPLGPVIGLFLASACTSLPEDLSGSVGLSTDDPNFIGAWWLGFLVIGITALIGLLPLFFFPEHMAEYYSRVDTEPKKNESTKENTLMSTIKEFFQGFLKMMKYPQVWTLIMAGSFAIYGIQMGSNMPRYMEIHFHQPTYLANIMAGIGVALSASLGSILGGFIMKKFRMGVVAAGKFYVGILVFVVLCCGALTFMSCPQAPMMGVTGHSSADVIFPCNSNCTCVDDASFDPVCANGTSYYSACHAGCMHFDAQESVYSDCECTSDLVKPGVCESDCPLMWAYEVVFFFTALTGASAETAVVIILLRTVGEDEKSFGLGFVSFAQTLLGFVPGPILFGQLLDSACLIWDESCGETGQCLYYDNNVLRLRSHGIPSIFMIVSLFFGIITYVIIYKRERKGKKKMSPGKR